MSSHEQTDGGGFRFRESLCLAIMSRLRHWWRELSVYRSECRRPRDLARLMRVRLSQSRVGRWVTPRPIVVEVDLRTLGPAVRLRSHSSDISVLNELLLGGSYEPLPGATATAPTVVDLGANIGLSFRWLRARYPRARFLCVEPESGNLEVLHANVRALDGEARIVAACVGGRERRVNLAGGRGDWGFRMAEASPDAGPGAVAVTTMDALLADAGIERIGVLKCDIEGAERELFENCSSWIGRVDAMSVECHADSISAEGLLAAVAANGGRFEVSHRERNPHLGFDILTLVRTAAPD